MSRKQQRRRSQARRDIIRAWRTGVRPINGYVSSEPLAKLEHITIPGPGPNTGQLVIGVDYGLGPSLTAVTEVEVSAEGPPAVHKISMVMDSHESWAAPGAVVVTGLNEHGEIVSALMKPTYVQTIEEWLWRKGLHRSWWPFPLKPYNGITFPEDE